MNKTPSTRKRGKILALVLFLIGLIIVTYIGNWWPSIMLVLGIPLAIMQYVQKRYYDMGITLFVFVGVFFSALFKWTIILPIIFSVGGIYIFFREWSEGRADADENEKPEN